MDKLEFFKTLQTFHPQGELIEIRAIHYSQPKNNIWSGYFTNHETAWNEVQRFDSEYNIYFVLNEINSLCYSMLQRDKMVKGAETTKDADIVSRKYVLIDLDCDRGGKKISSTKEELNQARLKAHEVRNFLRDQGFSFPVVAMSGAGYHLLYKIDNWENTKENEEIVKRFLLALSTIFSDDNVKVDTVVYNAARIDKLYGTIARKGTNCEERPHRLSKIVLTPDEFKPTEKEYFIKVADFLPKEDIVNYSTIKDTSDFNIDEFLTKYSIGIHSDTTSNGIRKIVLDTCPFSDEHHAPDSALFVMPNGAIGFKCFHASHAHLTFKDFRLHFDANAYDKKDYREYQFRQKQYRPKIEVFKPIEENEEKGKKWLSMTDIKRVDISELLSIPTGYIELDKKIIGLFAGELTIVSGLSSAGKTSWLDCIALNVIQKGFKVGVWSGEMQDWRFQGWIDQIAAGKNCVKKKEGYDNFYYTPSQYCEKIEQWLKGQLFLYNNSYGSRWEQLFSDVKDLVETEGVHLIILDNLAALNIDGYDGEKYSKQTKFIIDLKDYAKQKNIHIILVAHPRKENFFLRKESISGTADLTNIADNLFLIHRVGKDFEKRAGEFLGEDKVQPYLNFSTVIEVAKNRQLGIVDYLVGLYYEPESRRLKNDIAEHIIYGWQEQTQEQTFDMPAQSNFSSIMPNDSFEKEEELEDLPF